MGHMAIKRSFGSYGHQTKFSPISIACLSKHLGIEHSISSLNIVTNQECKNDAWDN